MNLQEILNKYSRIAIVGPSKAGKTTLSKQIKDRIVIHADDYVDMKWEEQPLAIIRNCKDNQRYCLEGCLAARALRKGLVVDAVIVLENSHEMLSPGAANFSKGVMTIFNQWKQSNGKVPVIYLDKK